MKFIKFSVITIAIIAISSSLSATSLSEALIEGKVTGDISITYEQRNVDKEISKYYQDTAYSVGSIGLDYKSGSYNNLSTEIGLRAYTNIWEEDSNSVTARGIGDSSERFYDKARKIMLSKAFIAYDKNDTHFKVGRQSLSTEWMGKIQDAVSLYTSPIENSKLEMIWSKKMGRVYSREFRDFNDLNENKGVYKAGFEYKFNEHVKTKTYYMTSPDKYNLVGGRINLDGTFGDAKIGSLIHVIETNEKISDVADGKMLEVKLYANYAGYSATLGYVKTGEENGWGSANTAGEQIVQFEEGDGMYYADAETIYFSVNKQVGPINITALYGEMEYTKNNYKEKEFDLWAGYNISKNLTLNAGFTVTNTDDKDAGTTDLTQLNTTLVYKF